MTTSASPVDEDDVAAVLSAFANTEWARRADPEERTTGLLRTEAGVTWTTEVVRNGEFPQPRLTQLDASTGAVTRRVTDESAPGRVVAGDDGLILFAHPSPTPALVWVAGDGGIERLATAVDDNASIEAIAPGQVAIAISGNHASRLELIARDGTGWSQPIVPDAPPSAFDGMMGPTAGVGTVRFLDHDRLLATLMGSGPFTFGGQAQVGGDSVLAELDRHTGTEDWSVPFAGAVLLGAWVEPTGDGISVLAQVGQGAFRWAGATIEVPESATCVLALLTLSSSGVPVDSKVLAPFKGRLNAVRTQTGYLVIESSFGTRAGLEHDQSCERARVVALTAEGRIEGEFNPLPGACAEELSDIELSGLAPEADGSLYVGGTIETGPSAARSHQGFVAKVHLAAPR